MLTPTRLYHAHETTHLAKRTLEIHVNRGSGLTREGRTGLFKFMFSMLDVRSSGTLPRRELENFVRRLRPDLTEVRATRNRKPHGYRFFSLIGRLLCGTFFFEVANGFFFLNFQVSFCPVKRGKRAGSSRNESDCSRRVTQMSFPLLESRSCEDFELAHFSIV